MARVTPAVAARLLGAQVGVQGLLAGGGAGEQGLFEADAEQPLAGGGARGGASGGGRDLFIQAGQGRKGGFLFGRGGGAYGGGRGRREVAADLKLDLALEAEDEPAEDVVGAVVVRVGDGGRVQHVHEAGEAGGATVVGWRTAGSGRRSGWTGAGPRRGGGPPCDRARRRCGPRR